MSNKRYAFPKSRRLLKKGEFRRVHLNGTKVSGNLFVLELLDNPKQKSRLGLTASRKFGKAHERNAFKRKIREIFRLTDEKLLRGRDIVIFPRRNAKEAPFQDLLNEFIELLTL